MLPAQVTSPNSRLARLALLTDSSRAGFPRARLWILCASIFILALALRLGAIFFGVGRLYQEPDLGYECENIARNLAATGEFANPYWTPTGPTAHSAPAYPFLLSLAFRLAGEGEGGRQAGMVLNALLASLAYALLPALAATAGLPFVVGIAAALAGALVPFRLLSELMPSAAGAPLRALTWIALHVLTFAWFGRGPATARRWLAYGACWGVAFHVDPVLLPACLFWLVLLARRERRQWAVPALPRLAMTFVGAALVLLPWTLRNRSQLGGWVFVRSNAGLELAVSNNDFARPIIPNELVPAEPSVSRNWMNSHPIGSEKHRAEIRTLGEAAYNRARLNEALDWIRRNPRRFAVLSLQRVRYFWFYPGMGKRWRNAILFPMVVLAAWGLFRMLKRHRFAGLLFLGDWVAYPLTYYFVQVSIRYRYPIEWTVLFLCCYAVWDRWSAAAGRLHSPR